MFTVYHSNKLETLKILLVHLIKSEPYENPFEAEQILVQSPGMSQWLKMAMAKDMGVAANIEFPLPATFIWDVFTQILPDVPTRSAFNKESMVWKLVQLLPQLKERTEFAPIKQYLERDTSELNLFQLAEKISDIFDSYLVYRPEWIDAWENELEVEENKDIHPWQPILWRELYRFTIELGQSHYHRANLYQALIQRLKLVDPSQLSLPKRLFIFGVTALPPRYIDALHALGQHIDVHLMFTNPCQHYWGDVRDRKTLARIEQARRKQWIFNNQNLSEGQSISYLKGSVDDNAEDTMHLNGVVGNELLASMGKLGRDNLWLLSQMDSEEHELFIDIQRDSLLHNIQADILHLEEHQDDHLLLTSDHKQSISKGDNSISFHSCHSAMREVEVLHDHLLSLFDQNDDLTPRDVIVMVADINAYSPAIQAVFGNAPGERYIPFSISDRTADQESPVLNAFLHLLNLPRSRCLASELLELLETPAIMRKFDISEEEFLQAKLWVEESGIRWGLNRKTAEQFDLPGTYQNTWEFGIARMLAGYAMSDDVEWLVHDNEFIAPYSEIQGLTAELAGKLSMYIDTIKLYRKRLNHTHSVDEWRQLIDGLLDGFFAVDIEEEVAFYTIRELIGQLKQQLSDSQYDASLPFDLLVYYLTQKVSGTRVSQKFLAGQVNFCTLMPMRSIPFKVVCLLGMNDGVYPRSIPAEGFDLMALAARRGDRSRRDDDRYLFLEALISAEQYLYISYVGHSIRDKSELTPSVLVTELEEYCQQNYVLEGDESLDVDVSGTRLLSELRCLHPMVPYSLDSFTGPNPSYASEWLPSVLRDSSQNTKNAPQMNDYWLDKASPIELELSDLQRFWRSPAQAFFNYRLGVYFNEPLSTQKDEEPFNLNGLDNYLLMSDLIPILLQNSGHEESLTCLRQKLSAQGRLPVGAFGELDFHQQVERVTPIVGELKELIDQPLADKELDLTLKIDERRSVNLVGWLGNRFSNGIVRFRPGRMRAQDYLSGWIEHLAHAASGEKAVTHMIALSAKGGAEHLFYQPIEDVIAAQRQLTALVRHFIDGLNTPIPYFPRTALAGIEAQYQKGQWVEDEDAVKTKMEQAFCGDYFSSGEGDDLYLSRLWPSWNDDVYAAAREWAISVLETPRQMAREFTGKDEE
ncbi:exodeoxyribonuclease V subunit gamma [Vibrio sp.]|nr:exodeoxyribonuclease V subunit gamma [Vibrio sp.]